MKENESHISKEINSYEVSHSWFQRGYNDRRDYAWRCSEIKEDEGHDWQKRANIFHAMIPCSWALHHFPVCNCVGCFQGNITGKGRLRGCSRGDLLKDSSLIIRQTQAPKQQASCHPFLLKPTQIHSHGQRVTFLHNDSEHRP